MSFPDSYASPRTAMSYGSIKSSHRRHLRDTPGELRLNRAHDPESGITYEFLTNNFILSPETIAQIYKARWDIEIFFKWIKQNLSSYPS